MPYAVARTLRLTASAPQRQLLTRDDFTYLGAYRLPQTVTGNWQSYFGRGLALRREASDVGNEVHLLSAAYNATPNHLIYEWRDRGLSTGGASPYSANSYSTATVVKTYGDVYSGKKLVVYNGSEVPLTAQLDGDFGIYWDDADSRLYWSYGYGYSSDANSWCLGYSTLDYSNNTGAGFGPWRLYSSGSGQSWKALSGGLVGVPADYAAAYLSGKRLAVGMGGYYSLVGACDASLGPSLTAVDAVPPGAAEKTDLASTPLVGYWPHDPAPGAGRDRCNRPEDAAALGVGETWPPDKFSWNDRVRCGAWIDTGTKCGVLFAGTYGRGRTQYLSSQIASSYHGHYWAIYDPYQFTPASGLPRHGIQPDVFDYQYPVTDYSNSQVYGTGAAYPVSSITSTAGAPQSSSTGCVVVCPSHGLGNGNYVEVFGASDPTYNKIWEVPPSGGVIDANSFRIRNTSASGNVWPGGSPSGAITLRRVGTNGPAGIGLDSPKGMAFDPVTNRLYVGYGKFQGVNGSDSRYMVLVYQVG